MPALSFLILAGWGAPTLCFEGSPACAHLWGRAGSLCPLLLSPDSSRRHLSPLAWCEHNNGAAQPVGGGSRSPLSSSSSAKPSWRGKPCNLPIACPGASRAGHSGRFAKGSGAAQTLERANLPRCSSIPSHGRGGGMQQVLVGGEQGRSALPATGMPWGVLLPLSPHPARDRLLGSDGV